MGVGVEGGDRAGVGVESHEGGVGGEHADRLFGRLRPLGEGHSGSLGLDRDGVVNEHRQVGIRRDL